MLAELELTAKEALEDELEELGELVTDEDDVDRLELRVVLEELLEDADVEVLL